MDSTGLPDERSADAPWPVAARSLLTARDRELYDRLHGLYPDHRLFVQVALSQLIDVPEDHPERLSIRNRFSQLVADFVLCRSDLTLVAVIELDDRSHRRPDRQATDARKTKALADAGLRLIRIPEGPVPLPDSLRRLIDTPSWPNAQATPDSSSVNAPLELLIDPNEAPPAAVASDHEWYAYKAVWNRVFKAAVAVSLLVAGWMGFAQLTSAPAKSLNKPLASTTASTRPTPPPSTPPPARATSVSSLAPGPSRAELEAHRETVIQQSQQLQKDKQRAWALYYTAPESCDHPVDWNAQVECGNQYMRAKKAFETQWSRNHGTDPGGSNVVLDNHSLDRAAR